MYEVIEQLKKFQAVELIFGAKTSSKDEAGKGGESISKASARVAEGQEEQAASFPGVS